MLKEEFYKKYANLPLGKRTDIAYIIKNKGTIGSMSVNDIYQRIKELDDDMRPKKIEQDKLLREVWKYFNQEPTKNK